MDFLIDPYRLSKYVHFISQPYPVEDIGELVMSGAAPVQIKVWAPPLDHMAINARINSLIIAQNFFPEYVTHGPESLEMLSARVSSIVIAQDFFPEYVGIPPEGLTLASAGVISIIITPVFFPVENSIPPESLRMTGAEVLTMEIGPP